MNKVYVDGVLEGAGIPNPTVTAHFESLNPKLKNFDPAIATTAQKGNAGEILGNDNMLLVRKNAGANQNTYTLRNIGCPAPESIDAPLKKGLDGIYENQTPPPSYVINESKWGTSQLNQTTADGPQMSKRWAETRLRDLDIETRLKVVDALETAMSNLLLVG